MDVWRRIVALAGVLSLSGALCAAAQDIVPGVWQVADIDGQDRAARGYVALQQAADELGNVPKLVFDAVVGSTILGELDFHSPWRASGWLACC